MLSSMVILKKRYIELPLGHPREGEPNKVCKLHKAIYGLKQSPRAWYSKLSSVLKVVGFKRSHADSSLFVRSGVLGKLVVLIYVDDLIITGDNVNEINALKCSLCQQFAIKDLRVLKYFLGIEMATSPKVDLLDEAHMLECKPARTPLLANLSWMPKRHTHEENGSNHIMAYTDADWAGNLVTWKSKKQIVVARSSAEAEYRAMAAAACELIWLKSLLFDLSFTSKEPMSLLCDNQAAMHIASNSSAMVNVALELIGGTLFTLLYDGVKQAMSKSSTFKSLMGDLKSTPDSLVPRDIQ
ncbi:unnamed protein product [Malus baccata var. baccata]